MKALTNSVQLLAVNTTSNAEAAAGDIDFGSALVSFIYFLAALLLIYLVLVLVNKWGKKNQGKNDDEIKQEEKKSEEHADKDMRDSKDSKDSTGEDNG